MKINYVEGDLFEGIQTIERPLVIAHVVNDKGGWGAGFVIPLGRTFPIVREAYLGWAKNQPRPDDSVRWQPFFRRGEAQIVQVADQLYVANMLAQTLGGTRPLYYNDLVLAMVEVLRHVPEEDFHIVAPMFGAGLAGGNWNVIEPLIVDTWIRCDIPVTIFYLPGTLPNNWSPPNVPENHQQV